MDGHNGAPVVTYREQTLEIALGPKGAFDGGNVGTPDAPGASRTGSDRRAAGPATAQAAEGSPDAAVVELLRKAMEWQALLESGEAANQADIARREGISRARVSRVMGMLRLAPEIQESIWSMPAVVRRPAVTERALRPIAQMKRPAAQLQAFELLVSQD